MDKKYLKILFLLTGLGLISCSENIKSEQKESLKTIKTNVNTRMDYVMNLK